ncbi:MAG TPA: LemA family protein [Clostridia bacterium]|nr:LemA family protein [Clostridia bacterium]
MPWLIALGVIALIVVWLIGIYNQLVKKRTMKDEAWSGVDVQLKRRYDLIPNLVETVQGYAGHEELVFKEVTDMRTRAMGATGVADKAAAENQLNGTLKTLFAVAEAYPELKANANFLDLQAKLADLEDQIQMARRYYNGTVRDYNIMCETFPSVFVASMFGFKKAEFFELNGAEERETPKVSFDNK